MWALNIGWVFNPVTLIKVQIFLLYLPPITDICDSCGILIWSVYTKISKITETNLSLNTSISQVWITL